MARDSNVSGSSVCLDCAAGTVTASPGSTICRGCTVGTFQDQQGQTTCDLCSTCTGGTFESSACDATTDAVCAVCDASCLTCDGSGPGQCTSCSPTQQLVAGECISRCGTAPDPSCLVAAKAKLQANGKKPGKEKFQVAWQKIGTATTRASFGDPVSGTTSAVVCVFNDVGTLVQETIVDRAAQTCGAKPCWKTTGTQGLAYADELASDDGITKLQFVGGAADKGKAQAQGKNDAPKGLTSLPTGLAAALAGNTQPTIQLVTTDGLCVGATMNKVGKDDGLQYKAQRK
jgi:hypothetical protein